MTGNRRLKPVAPKEVNGQQSTLDQIIENFIQQHNMSHPELGQRIMNMLKKMAESALSHPDFSIAWEFLEVAFDHEAGSSNPSPSGLPPPQTFEEMGERLRALVDAVFNLAGQCSQGTSGQNAPASSPTSSAAAGLSGSKRRVFGNETDLHEVTKRLKISGTRWCSRSRSDTSVEAEDEPDSNSNESDESELEPGTDNDEEK